MDNSDACHYNWCTLQNASLEKPCTEKYKESLDDE